MSTLRMTSKNVEKAPSFLIIDLKSYKDKQQLRQLALNRQLRRCLADTVHNFQKIQQYFKVNSADD